MTFEDFIASRVAMTKTTFDNTYGEGIVNSDKVYVYADGLNIEVQGAQKFYVVIERSDYETVTLEDAERILWDEFANEEINR